MDFLGFHLVTSLSTLSPHFLFALHAYKAFVPYPLLHFLMKLLFDLCAFSFFLTSVSICCDIYLWSVGCSLLFLNIPSSFPLYTSIHNSLNFTYLKELSVLSTNLFLGFKYWEKWASKLTTELNYVFNAITFFASKKVIQNDFFPA